MRRATNASAGATNRICPLTQFDSFITHKHQKSDLKKAHEIGLEKYSLEQKEKMQILEYLLTNYNDGRKKTLFCVAVNLLELPQIREAIHEIKKNGELILWGEKERCTYVAELFLKLAKNEGIELKLRRKK